MCLIKFAVIIVVGLYCSCDNRNNLRNGFCDVSYEYFMFSALCTGAKKKKKDLFWSIAAVET